MTEMGEQEDEDDGTKECRVSRVRRENGRQCLNTRPIGVLHGDVRTRTFAQWLAERKQNSM